MISSLCSAAPRYADLPELYQVQMDLGGCDRAHARAWSQSSGEIKCLVLDPETYSTLKLEVGFGHLLRPKNEFRALCLPNDVWAFSGVFGSLLWSWDVWIKICIFVPLLKWGPVCSNWMFLRVFVRNLAASSVVHFISL
ncbi:hypothetical protein Tco_1390721 [Tanacetum coccineum]